MSQNPFPIDLVSEQPTQVLKQSTQTSPQPSQVQQLISTADQSTPGVEAKQKRVHYTPELKLLLLRLERTGHQGADLRKKVNVMVGDRKGALEARKLLSEIETCERRNELQETVKAESSAEVKKEKAVSEILRDNLTKRLSKKRDFQVVVEAREVVDLTSPGNVPQKRCQIRENLHAKTSNSESKEKMREDFSRLTDVFINYMTKPSKCNCSGIDQSSSKASSSKSSKSCSSKSSESCSSKSSASSYSKGSESNPVVISGSQSEMTLKLATKVENLEETISRLDAN
ncbi:hypothetical protein BGX38DRAFT_1264827 [Terfezia claveryi]|nr:hypothetical protein BGX38DRAFT_1264827 [Terfezia claveryi]